VAAAHLGRGLDEQRERGGSHVRAGQGHRVAGQRRDARGGQGSPGPGRVDAAAWDADADVVAARAVRTAVRRAVAEAEGHERLALVRDAVDVQVLAEGRGDVARVRDAVEVAVRLAFAGITDVVQVAVGLGRVRRRRAVVAGV